MNPELTNFSEFHFLRPEALWGFVGLSLILALLFLHDRKQSSWQARIAPHLAPHMISGGSRNAFLFPKALLVLFIAIALIALAGPTWQRVDDPGVRSQSAIVVLLDVSRSMLAEDIPPNRLERAKFKISDLLDENPGARISLIAYAGSAHTVVPLSSDYSTIKQYLEVLIPDVMPVKGTNLPEALALADSILAPIMAPSTILVCTDDVQLGSFDQISATAARNSIEFMVFGTPAGSTIPWGGRSLVGSDGSPVQVSLNVEALGQLGSIDGVDAVPVTLDNSDVAIIANRIRANLDHELDDEDDEEDWLDFGYVAIFPLCLISLLFFRRGWSINWIIVLGVISITGCSENMKPRDLFISRDVQAASKYANGDFEGAAELFEASEWKAMALYESGDLEEAAGEFAESPSAENFYNQGVIYAEMGDLQAASESFKAASEMDPELQVARQNLDITLDRMLVVGMIDSTSADSIRKEADKPKPTDFQEYTEQPDEKDRAQESDQTYEGKGDITEMGSVEMQEDPDQMFDPDAQLEEAKASLLRQVDADPALFLKRKFRYQIGQRAKKPVQTTEPW